MVIALRVTMWDWDHLHVCILPGAAWSLEGGQLWLQTYFMQRESWMTSSHCSVLDHDIHRGSKGRQNSSLACLVCFHHRDFPRAIGNDNWQAPDTRGRPAAEGHVLHACPDARDAGVITPFSQHHWILKGTTLVFPTLTDGLKQSEDWRSLPLNWIDFSCAVPFCCHSGCPKTPA